MMKFTAVLPDLQRLLQTVIQAVPPKSTLPALENFMLELSGNTLSATATDQEITIISTLQVEGKGDGSVLAPARKLVDIVKALGNTGNIDFEADSKIMLRTSRGEYSMFGQPTDIYPQPPRLQGNTTFTLQREILSAIATKTIFAVSKDEYRPSMTGVLFEFDGGSLRAVSTDGYRLVRLTKTFENGSPEMFSAIIPSRAVELLKKPDADSMQLSFTDTHGIFTGGTTTIITRLIDERFPVYQNVIPANNDKTVSFTVGDALSAVKRIALFSNSDTKQIRFRFQNGKWELLGEDTENGSNAHETIDADFAGEDLEIGFNYRFIEEALSHVADSTSATVHMSFSTPARPALLMPMVDEKPDESTLMLVMPVRI